MSHLIDVPVLPARALRLVPSYSRLETFTNCERRYLFDVLYPQPSSPAQAHGQAVHGQLELAVQGKPVPGEMLPQTREGLEAWERLDADLVATEAWVDRVRDLPWSGKIDVLAEDENGRFVVDWKTCGSLMSAKSPWEARRSLQLHVYCLAAECRRAVFVYLPTRGEHRIVDLTFTPAELDLAYKRLKIFDEVIRERWAAAGASLTVAGGMTQPSTLDLRAFSIANPDWLFCSDKWCPHWGRCLGAETNGED